MASRLMIVELTAGIIFDFVKDKWKSTRHEQPTNTSATGIIFFIKRIFSVAFLAINKSA
jgi:hypothetical protein